MSLIAVDLAAKFSAAVWIDHPSEPHGTPTILGQWDSWQRTPTDFLLETCERFDPISNVDTIPDVLVVEDLPQRVPWMTTVKDVCRLQGRIVERMHLYEAVGRILFVPPHEWRRTYTGLGRGTGPDAVVDVAAKHGYTPPDLTPRTGARGSKATARKVSTDYCAAFLIGRWAYERHFWTGEYDAPTTTRITNV